MFNRRPPPPPVAQTGIVATDGGTDVVHSCRVVLLVPGSAKCVGEGICVVRRSDTVAAAAAAGRKISLTHARACARTPSHTHTLSARARRRKAGFLHREKKTLTAGEVWRPSIVRRSREGSAGKLGPIHRCTRARTEARVCSRGFILPPPLPSHPCAIPPSILNPLLCTSVRGAHSGRSI